MGFAQSLTEIEQAAARLREQAGGVRRRGARIAGGLDPGVQVLGAAHIVVVSRVDLFQDILFVLSGQLGRLLFNPQIQFVAGLEELLPGHRVANRPVAEHLVGHLAQRVLEMLRDTEALRIDLT